MSNAERTRELLEKLISRNALRFVYDTDMWKVHLKFSDDIEQMLLETPSYRRPLEAAYRLWDNGFVEQMSKRFSSEPMDNYTMASLNDCLDRHIQQQASAKQELWRIFQHYYLTVQYSTPARWDGTIAPFKWSWMRSKAHVKS